jgi:hypothetical protein
MAADRLVRVALYDIYVCCQNAFPLVSIGLCRADSRLLMCDGLLMISLEQKMRCLEVWLAAF